MGKKVTPKSRIVSKLHDLDMPIQAEFVNNIEDHFIRALMEEQVESGNYAEMFIAWKEYYDSDPPMCCVSSEDGEED